MNPDEIHLISLNLHSSAYTLQVQEVACIPNAHQTRHGALCSLVFFPFPTDSSREEEKLQHIWEIKQQSPHWSPLSQAR